MHLKDLSWDTASIFFRIKIFFIETLNFENKERISFCSHNLTEVLKIKEQNWRKDDHKSERIE